MKKDEGSHPSAGKVNMDVDSLEVERSETFTILDVGCDREGKEKSENPQNLAEEDSRCVLALASIGPLAAKRPELVTILNMIRV